MGPLHRGAGGSPLLIDSAEPIVELRRLYEVSLERFQPFLSCVPSKARPAGITDRAVIDGIRRRVLAFLARHLQG